MLVIMKLYPKYGLSRLWNELESHRKDLYLDNVTPVFAFKVEGKGHVSVMLDTKAIDAIEKEFMGSIRKVVKLRKTETVPLMSPIFFPVKEGVDYTLERYITYLEIAPGKYEEVYDKIMNTKFSDDTYLRWMSYSLGKEDIILFMFSDDRESTQAFVNKNIEHIGGVNTLEIERVFEFMPILSTEAFRKVKEPFVFSHPPGYNGAFVNPDLNKQYCDENCPMISIVRMMAKGNLNKLWSEVEKDVEQFKANGMKPMFATQSEGRSHLSVIFEHSNFEMLKKFIVNNVHTLENVRQTRTVPLLEPHYFSLPEGHPMDMERYLISIRADPEKLPSIRRSLEGMQIPGSLHQTFIAYSLGEYDIFSSVLATSREAVEKYAESNLDNLDGMVFYNITSQQKVVPLATPEERQAHKAKFS